MEGEGGMEDFEYGCLGEEEGENGGEMIVEEKGLFMVAWELLWNVGGRGKKEGKVKERVEGVFEEIE